MHALHSSRLVWSLLENLSTRNPGAPRIPRPSHLRPDRRHYFCLQWRQGAIESKLFAGIVRDLQASERPGFFVAKKKRGQRNSAAAGMKFLPSHLSDAAGLRRSRSWHYRPEDI